MATTNIVQDSVRKEDKVEEPISAYTEFMDKVELPKTLMQGTEAMRDKGQKYLPKEEKESQGAYNVRLKRSVLLNMYRRTVQKLVGEVFSKDLVLSDKTAEAVLSVTKDIDRNGKDLNRFAQEGLTDALAYGVTHFLVDHPHIRTRENAAGKKEFYDQETGDWRLLTESVKKEKGWRPYWVKIAPENVIGWRTEKKEGRTVLTQVRIKETTEEPYGLYGVRTVKRIRVLEPGSWQLWEYRSVGPDTSKQEWVLVEEGSTSFDMIPLFTFLTGEKLTEMTCNPPLQDLAYLNLCHWQSDSDQRNILHYARLVLYFGKMLDVDEQTQEVVFGPNRLIHSTNADSDLKTVEHSGKAIDAGRQDLKDLETRMSMFGLTYLMPRTGTMTATAKAIETSENDSALKRWALAYKHFLEECLQFTARLLGIDDVEKAGTVTINTEFRSFLRDIEPKVLLEAYKLDIVPRELVIEEFKRRDLIKDEWDFVDIMNMMENEARQATGGGFAQLGGSILGAGGATF